MTNKDLCEIWVEELDNPLLKDKPIVAVLRSTVDKWLSQFIQTYPGGYERSYDSTKRFARNKLLKELVTSLYPKGECQK